MRVTIQRFITQNRSYTAIVPQGVVVHETATPGATAKSEYAYFNSSYRAASAHAFVDWIETIQTVPWFEKAWHAGPTANKRFIGVEMCRPAKHNVEKFIIVYNETVALFSRLFHIVLKIDKITPDNLMSHDECRIKFKDTTHTDPTGYFKEYGKTMSQFRADVQTAINNLIKEGK